MCGVILDLGREGTPHRGQSGLFKALLQRGPDCGGEAHFKTTDGLSCVMITACLHMRGPSRTSPPLTLPNGDIFFWNGEVFGGPQIGDLNDTEVVGKALQGASSNEILDFLSTIRGPWAFVFWQSTEQKLWFGRDIFGRRSLVIHAPTPSKGHVDDSNVLRLCSVTAGVPAHLPSTCPEEEQAEDGEVCGFDSSFRYWNEVPALGVFCLHLGPKGDVIGNQDGEAWGEILGYPMKLHRWQSPITNQTAEGMFCGRLMSPLSPFNEALPVDLDSAVLLPNHEIIASFNSTADELLQRLSKAVERRVKPLPSDAPRLAVLFSGGIDSTVLALLADRYIPENEPIDLINVAFGNENSVRNSICLEKLKQDNQEAGKKKKKQTQKKDIPPEEVERLLYNVPDRKTGRAAVIELSSLCPSRPWNFVEVNIPMTELERHKSDVSALVHPLNTVMDLSIACALWFAARGQGHLIRYLGSSMEPMGDYLSPAKALLIGMGADEQLGGYSRHRTKYGYEGWAGLVAEMKLDVDRISHRNLGRDDRVVSDNSREGRYPFLDEELVSFLNTLPVWVKADMRYPRGL
eukprot:Ihof_evm4s398 gene=Ihof_evmTU4s398